MMKTLTIMLSILILLSGCTNKNLYQVTSDSQSPTEINEEIISTPVPMEISIYCGNDNADGFDCIIHEVYFFNSYTLIEHLIETGTLDEGIALQSEYYKGTCLHLDFNTAFRDQLCSTGSAGEYIMIGSLVNTFLDNYKDTIDSIFITVNGQIIESGHVIYDFELTRHD